MQIYLFRPRLKTLPRERGLAPPAMSAGLNTLAEDSGSCIAVSAALHLAQCWTIVFKKSNGLILTSTKSYTRVDRPFQTESGTIPKPYCDLREGPTAKRQCAGDSITDTHRPWAMAMQASNNKKLRDLGDHAEFAQFGRQES